MFQFSRINEAQEQLEPKCFRGRVEGKIAYEERGKQGFGFDPIFQPFGGKGITFAEMTTQKKQALTQHKH